MVLGPNWNEQVEVAGRQVSVGAEFQKGRRLRLRSRCRRVALQTWHPPLPASLLVPISRSLQ